MRGVALRAATRSKRSGNRAIFLVLGGATLTYALVQSLLSPALGLLAVELHTGQDTVTWLVIGYLLAASICTPIVGRLGDSIGREKILVISLVVQCGASVLGAMAPNIGVMIVARVLQAVGAGATPIGYGIIRDEFPRNKVAPAVGLLSAVGAASGGLGLVLAGPIVQTFNTHWLFWLPAIASLVVAVSAWRIIPPSPVRTGERTNWPAAALMSAWLICLLVGVSRAQYWGWESPRILAVFAAAPVFGVLWVVVELRARTPLINMRMMRIPAVWTANLVALFVGMVMFALFNFLPRFVEAPSSGGYGFGASITVAGIIMLPMQAAMFSLGAVTGFLASKFGARTMLIAGVATLPVPCVMLAAFHSHLWQVVVATVLLGAGMGVTYASMASNVVHAVPRNQTGVATGMNTNFRTIGGSIGSALMATIVTASVFPNGVPKEVGYTISFICLAGIAVIAAAVATAVPRPTSRRAMVSQEFSAEVQLLTAAHVSASASKD